MPRPLLRRFRFALALLPLVACAPNPAPGSTAARGHGGTGADSAKIFVTFNRFNGSDANFMHALGTAKGAASSGDHSQPRR